MEVVWDPAKAKQNLRKHGVRFADTVTVLDDPYALTITDSDSEPEEPRWVTMGADAQRRILVVIYTFRGEDLPLISARPAEPHEREEYVEQL